jgi:peptidoglycan/LPS O-acetylase OafA/YrhL
MQFLQNVHRFRSLAIIGIATAHVLHNFTWAADDLRFRAINCLANESSIWFFFIAGFLFQHLSHRFEYSTYLAKKAQYVVLPYLIVSIPALIGSLTFYDQGMVEGFAQWPLMSRIMLFLVTGNHLEPLWFVPTITLIFLITPVLIAADKARWPYFLLALLMPLSAWLGRDGFLILTGLNGNWSPVSKAIYLLSAFVFGMACCRYSAQMLKLVAKWKWLLLAFALSAYIFAVVSSHTDKIAGLYTFKILAAPLLVYALRSPRLVTLDRLSILGHASFGIFFVHCYFLAGLKFARIAMGLPEKLPGSILGVGALTVAVLAASLLSLHILQLCFGARCAMLAGCNMPRVKLSFGLRNLVSTLQVKAIVAAR